MAGRRVCIRLLWFCGLALEAITKAPILLTYMCYRISQAEVRKSYSAAVGQPSACPKPSAAAALKSKAGPRFLSGAASKPAADPTPGSAAAVAAKAAAATEATVAVASAAAAAVASAAAAAVVAEPPQAAKQTFDVGAAGKLSKAPDEKVDNWYSFTAKVSELLLGGQARPLSSSTLKYPVCATRKPSFCRRLGPQVRFSPSSLVHDPIPGRNCPSKPHARFVGPTGCCFAHQVLRQAPGR